jgi:phosphoglycerate kinase
MKTVNDIDFKGKKALIRVDFNVPLNEDFKVTDDSRIKAAKPTILKILEDGGSCILMSHLGRPKDKEAKFSLSHIVQAVSDDIGVQVKFVDDCIGSKVTEAVSELKMGEILLLENLRYYTEEKNGDRDFAEKLSKFGDIYVNDAFGTAHRAHASTSVIADFFPENKCFGLLLASEIENVKKSARNQRKTCNRNHWRRKGVFKNHHY